MDLIINTRSLIRELKRLDEEKFITVELDGKEYDIECITKRSSHCDNDKEWHYTLKLQNI